MSPAVVIALLEGAVKLGLAVPEIIGWAKQQHPELGDPPPPDAEEKLHGEADEMIRKKFPHDDEP